MLVAEDLLTMVRIAYEAERHFDTLLILRLLLEADTEVTDEIRYHMSVAYKKLLLDYRFSRRTILQTQKDGKTENMRNAATLYRKELEQEYKTICYDAVDVLEKYFIPIEDEPESDIFFHKMKADCYRHLAEIEETRKDTTYIAAKSRHEYELALQTAINYLPPIHSLRLSITLNMSILYLEVLDSVEDAIHITAQALNAITPDMKIEDGNSIQIIEILRYLLPVWKNQDLEITPEDQKRLETAFHKVHMET